MRKRPKRIILANIINMSKKIYEETCVKTRDIGQCYQHEEVRIDVLIEGLTHQFQPLISSLLVD